MVGARSRYFYSWQLGMEVNGEWFGENSQRFAAWGHANHVVFCECPLLRRRRLPLGAERLVRARADPSIFDRRTANVTAGGRLSNWRAAMHHFVAYAMGAAGQNWGDQDSPPIQRP